MNFDYPLNEIKPNSQELQKVKHWADIRSKIYGYCFVVRKLNENLVIQTLRFVIDHIDDCKIDEIVYCTDEVEFEKLITEHFMKF